MILKWILEVVGAFVSFVAGLFSFVPDPPAFLSEIPGYVGSAAGFMSGTAAWLPWDVLMGVLALWAVSVTASIGIRVVRMVASLLTGGGGSAA